MDNFVDSYMSISCFFFVFLRLICNPLHWSISGMRGQHNAMTFFSLPVVQQHHGW